MEQTYSNKAKSSELEMKPTKNTVKFILNFSKSLKVIKTTKKSKIVLELNCN